MELNASKMDELVYEIIRDHKRSDPPVERQEIIDYVMDYLKKHISDYVLPSISRLVESGAVIEKRDDSDISRHGRPYRYSLPPKNV